MKVLFLARATLYSVFGGDSVQITSTARYLNRLGISVDIRLTDELIDYSEYDLMHLFNITRPQDLMHHIRASNLPYILSTIFIDFTEYEQANSGMRALLTRHLTTDKLEYMKAIARWIKNGETVQSREYLFAGHREAVKRVANGAAYLLPNSESEYQRFKHQYGISRPYRVVYNGIDKDVFAGTQEQAGGRNETEVLCVARIEGNKNQINLIRALNGTRFKLKIIGKAAPNHQVYYHQCKKIAAANITFEDHVPQESLNDAYSRAKAHVLPSWNETCGLSSLEAGYCGCNLVITDKGDTTEYFGTDAWYCDPADPGSIYKAVCDAAEAPFNARTRDRVNDTFNWKKAAQDTLEVYLMVLNERKNGATKPFVLKTRSTMIR